LLNGGILVVVSFHSIEDKIVKNFFNLYSNFSKNPSRYLPIQEKKISFFKKLSKKPLTPTRKEINQNNSSRSAKLRYATRNNNLFSHPDQIYKKFENYLKIEAMQL